jgi:hypothetical protein
MVPSSNSLAFTVRPKEGEHRKAEERVGYTSDIRGGDSEMVCGRRKEKGQGDGEPRKAEEIRSGTLPTSEVETPRGMWEGRRRGEKELGIRKEGLGGGRKL